MRKLSVVLATRNEEENLAKCLASVKDLADEIIIVDEYSTDSTREIAKKFGAKVILERHHEIFHITKQKALEAATSEWILQLDADEKVTDELAIEIQEVLSENHKSKINKLFERHQALIEERDGAIGKKTGEVVGYFIPRRNIFLGKRLIHAGVYPDAVIRLVKKGKAHFPQKSVHEQIILDGEVDWLSGDLLHYDSPTLSRYLSRMNRYTDLKARELKDARYSKSIFSFFHFVILLPTYYFLLLFLRHKGFLDGYRGFLWSFFSALHYPVGYFKYLTGEKT